MYTTVFETKLGFASFFPFIIPLLLIAAGVYGMIDIFKKRKGTLLLTFISLFNVIAFLTLILISYNWIQAKNKIYDNYVKGNYDIIEGQIQKLYPMKEGRQGTEYFYINEVCFEYSSFTLFGYSADHKLITGDGQKVRISYVPVNGQNVIVKLEVKK